jgi:hypothetical protein
MTLTAALLLWVLFPGPPSLFQTGRYGGDAGSSSVEESQMIKVMAEGGGWSVKRDGRLVQEYGSSGVHKTKGSAYRYALRLVGTSGEEIDVEGDLDITDAEP